MKGVVGLLVLICTFVTTTATLNTTSCACDTGCIRNHAGGLCDWNNSKFCYLNGAEDTITEVVKVGLGHSCRIEGLDYNGLCVSSTCHPLAHRCIPSTASYNDYIIQGYDESEECDDGNSFVNDACVNGVIADAQTELVLHANAEDSEATANSNGYVEYVDIATEQEYCDGDTGCVANDYQTLFDGVNTALMAPVIKLKTSSIVNTAGNRLRLNLNITDPNADPMVTRDVISRGGTYAPTTEYLSKYDFACCYNNPNKTEAVNCHLDEAYGCQPVAVLDYVAVKCISTAQSVIPSLGCTLNTHWSIDVYDSNEDVVPASFVISQSGGTTVTFSDSSVIAKLSSGEYTLEITPVVGNIGALQLEVEAHITFNAASLTSKKRNWFVWVKGAHSAVDVGSVITTTKTGGNSITEGAETTIPLITSAAVTTSGVFQSGLYKSDDPGYSQSQRFKYRVTQPVGTLLSKADGKGSRFQLQDPDEGNVNGDITTKDMGYIAIDYQHGLCDDGHTAPIPNSISPTAEFNTRLAALETVARSWYHSGYESTALYGTLQVEICTYNFFVVAAGQCGEGATGWQELSVIPITVNPKTIVLNAATMTHTDAYVEALSPAASTLNLVAGTTDTTKMSELWIYRFVTFEDVNAAVVSGSTNSTTLGATGVTFACDSLSEVTADVKFSSDANNAIIDAEWGSNGLTDVNVWDGCTVQWPASGDRPLELKVTIEAFDRAPGGTPLSIGSLTTTFETPIQVRTRSNGVAVTVTAPTAKVVTEGGSVGVPLVPQLNIMASPVFSSRQMLDGVYSSATYDSSYGEKITGLWIAVKPPTAGSDLAVHLTAIGLTDWDVATTAKFFTFTGMTTTIDAAVRTKVTSYGYESGYVLFQLQELTDAISPTFELQSGFHTFNAPLDCVVYVESIATSEVYPEGNYSSISAAFTIQVDAAAPATPTMVVSSTVIEVTEGNAFDLLEQITSITTLSQFGDDRPYKLRVTQRASDDSLTTLQTLENEVGWKIPSFQFNEESDAYVFTFLDNITDTTLQLATFRESPYTLDLLTMSTAAVMGTSGTVWGVNTWEINTNPENAATPFLTFDVEIQAIGINDQVSAWSSPSTLSFNVKPSIATLPAITADASVTVIAGYQLVPVGLVLAAESSGETTATSYNRLSLIFSATSGQQYNLWYWSTAHGDLSIPEVTTNRIAQIDDSTPFEMFCQNKEGMTAWVSDSTLYDCTTLNSNHLFVEAITSVALTGIQAKQRAYPWAYEQAGSRAGWATTDKVTAESNEVIAVTRYELTDLGSLIWTVGSETEEPLAVYGLSTTGFHYKITRPANSGETGISVRIDFTTNLETDATYLEASCLTPSSTPTECNVAATPTTGSFATVNLYWAAAETDQDYDILISTTSAFTAAYVGQDTYIDDDYVITGTVVQTVNLDLPLPIPSASTRQISPAIVGHIYTAPGTGVLGVPVRNEATELMNYEYDQLNTTARPRIKLIRDNCATYKTSRLWGGRTFHIRLESQYTAGIASSTKYLPLTKDGVAIATPCTDDTCLFNTADSNLVYEFEFGPTVCEYEMEVWGDDATIPHNKYSYEIVTRRLESESDFAQSNCQVAHTALNYLYSGSMCYYSLFCENDEWVVSNNLRMDRERKVRVTVYSWQGAAEPTVNTIETNLDVTYSSLSYDAGLFTVSVEVPLSFGLLPVIYIGSTFDILEKERAAGCAMGSRPTCNNLIAATYDCAGDGGENDATWIARIFSSGSDAKTNPSATTTFFGLSATTSTHATYTASFLLSALQDCLYDSEVQVTREIQSNLIEHYQFDISTMFVRPFDSTRPPTQTHEVVLQENGEDITVNSVYMTSSENANMIGYSTSRYQIERTMHGEETITFNEHISTREITHAMTNTITCSGCNPSSTETCAILRHRFFVKTDLDSSAPTYKFVGIEAANIETNWQGGVLTVNTAETATVVTEIDDSVYTEIQIESTCTAVPLDNATYFTDVTNQGHYSFTYQYSRCNSAAAFQPSTSGRVCALFGESMTVEVVILFNANLNTMKETAFAYDVLPKLYVSKSLVAVESGDTIQRGESMYITAEMQNAVAKDHMSVFMNDVALGVLRQYSVSAVMPGTTTLLSDIILEDFLVSNRALFPSIAPFNNDDVDTINLAAIATWIANFANNAITGLTSFTINGITLKPGVFANYKLNWDNYVNLLILKLVNMQSSPVADYTTKNIAKALHPYEMFQNVIANGKEDDIRWESRYPARNWIQSCKLPSAAQYPTYYDTDSAETMCQQPMQQCKYKTKFSEELSEYVISTSARFEWGDTQLPGFDMIRLDGSKLPALFHHVSADQIWTVGIRYYVYDCKGYLLNSRRLSRSLRGDDESDVIMGSGLEFDILEDSSLAITLSGDSTILQLETFFAQTWVVVIGIIFLGALVASVIGVIITHYYRKHRSVVAKQGGKSNRYKSIKYAKLAKSDKKKDKFTRPVKKNKHAKYALYA